MLVRMNVPRNLIICVTFVKFFSCFGCLKLHINLVHLILLYWLIEYCMKAVKVGASFGSIRVCCMLIPIGIIAASYLPKIALYLNLGKNIIAHPIHFVAVNFHPHIMPFRLMKSYTTIIFQHSHARVLVSYMNSNIQIHELQQMMDFFLFHIVAIAHLICHAFFHIVRNS